MNILEKVIAEGPLILPTKFGGVLENLKNYQIVKRLSLELQSPSLPIEPEGAVLEIFEDGQ